MRVSLCAGIVLEIRPQRYEVKQVEQWFLRDFMILSAKAVLIRRSGRGAGESGLKSG